VVADIKRRTAFGSLCHKDGFSFIHLSQTDTNSRNKSTKRR
jgi:hypothetical protein